MLHHEIPSNISELKPSVDATALTPFKLLHNRVYHAKGFH